MERAEEKSFASLTYKAAEKLVKTASPALSADRRVFVASVVNLDNLQKSSTLGRLIGEHTASQLAQLGYEITESRLRPTIKVQEGTGELILSRDLRSITGGVNAAAIVAGTYAVGGKWIYINLKMMNANSGQVISAVDFVIPLDEDTKKLI